ncbi:MAG: CRTAC1 family protein [Planctomycetota bacterium]
MLAPFRPVDSGRALVWIVLLLILTAGGYFAWTTTNGPAGSGGQFVDVTREAGIDFEHTTGRTGQKFLIETMGSGAVWFDYDRDGDLDLYLVDSGPLPDAVYDGPNPKSRLYENRGDGTFEDVTERAGLSGNGYGMGACAGDIDGDGDEDLFVTQVGPNALYRNEGDGTFKEGAAELGVADPRWATSATFLDIENDGDLDLYVVNYVKFDFQDPIVAQSRSRGGPARYPHVKIFQPERDILYRNDGRGHFEDVTLEAGLERTLGRGLGVIATDYDQDGDVDLFVANDSDENFLFANDGTGHFGDETARSSFGFNADGKTEAGMGIAAADADGDGDTDVIVTNFSMETNTLYRNDSDGLFTDVSHRTGIAEPSLVPLSFGIAFLDYDNDGWQDLAVANGHIDDLIGTLNSALEYEQTDQIYRNESGQFRDVSHEMGEYFRSVKRVGRGLCVADYDNDGDSDLLFLQNGAAPNLLRNDGPSGRWIGLELRTGPYERIAYGARVTVEAGGRTLMRELNGGSSYLCQNDPRLLVGLGEATRVDRVTVTWPSGRTEIVESPEIGRYHTLIEGRTKSD